MIGLLDNFLNLLKAFSGYGEQSLKLQIGIMTDSGRDDEKKLNGRPATAI
jgi:hypothetical protein